MGCRAESDWEENLGGRLQANKRRWAWHQRMGASSAPWPGQHKRRRAQPPKQPAFQAAAPPRWRDNSVQVHQAHVGGHELQAGQGGRICGERRARSEASWERRGSSMHFVST